MADTLPPLRIRHFRRMRRQRVYGVTVNWPKGGPKPPLNAPPLTLRLLMAGAQVVPTEQTLDPHAPADRATFYVTPLAKGWLRNEKLEILVNGRKVQEQRLPGKVVSQRGTLVLLLLTFFVPWFILTYFKYSPIQAYKQHITLSGRIDKEGSSLNGRVDKLPINVPHVEMRNRLQANLPDYVNDIKFFETDTATTIATFYDDAVKKCQDYPVAFYAAAGLLMLTLLWWLTHLEMRKTRYTQPIAYT